MKKIITEKEFFELINKGVHDFSAYTLAACTVLSCERNQLTALPELPACTVLYCSYNQLTALPELPACTVLYCSYNQLTALPELSDCKELYCSHNQLTALPALSACIKLYCSDNLLTALPALSACIKLYCSDNQLVKNYIVSPTSGRSVYYNKNTNKVIAGCFCGSPEEFLNKGWEQEKKEWVKDFYNRITNENAQ